MSLRCPQCGTAVPAAKVFWFIRLFSFSCMHCKARLALTGETRTMLLASVAASVVVSYLVKSVMASDTPAIIFFFVGIVIGCGLVWRFGALGIVDDGQA
jgi:hypothetical protein